MTELKYDPELPFALVYSDEEETVVTSRFIEREDAESWLEFNNFVNTRVVDTTPKPKIPEGAEFITWSDPYNNGEERIAMKYGHPSNKVWRMGVDTLDEVELVKEWIGDAEVTVLVRKEEP